MQPRGSRTAKKDTGRMADVFRRSQSDVRMFRGSEAKAALAEKDSCARVQAQLSSYSERPARPIRSVTTVVTSRPS